MTTSLSKSSISAIPSDGKPTADQFVFFSRRLKNQLHAEVLRRFLEEKKANNLTKKELARRMDKDPAQINRLLSAPKNVEIETVSQLLLALGYIPKIDSVKLTDLYRSNYFESGDIIELRGRSDSKKSTAEGKTSKSGTKTEYDMPIALTP